MSRETTVTCDRCKAMATAGYLPDGWTTIEVWQSIVYGPPRKAELPAHNKPPERLSWDLCPACSLTVLPALDRAVSQ